MMKIEATVGRMTAAKVLTRCTRAIIEKSGTMIAANGMVSSSSRKAKTRSRMRERKISKP